jgi:hypothetical protein
MIRTDVVHLTTITGVAFKQKLTSGGAGITIITPHERAVFTINKRDGTFVPFGKVDNHVFTNEISEEAFELTKNMPFKRLGKVGKVGHDHQCEESPVEHEVDDEKADIDVMASTEYKEFIAEYTDKNDKFSYQLMNKDLIQFASRSNIVGKKINENQDVDKIVRYIVKSKAASLAMNKGMDEEMLTAFIETMDSMNTRSAFKELRAYLRDRMSRKRKAGRR